MARYEIQDDQGRKLEIDVEGDLTPEIAEQAFANYDAIQIASAGPRGSEARRRAQAGVVAKAEEATLEEGATTSDGRAADALNRFMQAGSAGVGAAVQAIPRVGGLLLRAGEALSKSGVGVGPGGAFPTEPALPQQAPVSPQQMEEMITQDPLYKAGAGVVSGGREAFPTNPQFNEDFTSTLASGAGQLVPTVAAGLVNPALAVAQYGMSSGQQAAQEARSTGNPEMAQAAFGVTAPIGAATEAVVGVVPGAQSLRRLGANRLTRALTEGAVREGAQEGLEQVAGNVAASEIGYDPNRPLMQGVPEAAAAGAILGSGVAGAAAGVDARNRANRLAAIRQQRDPFNQLNQIVENAPIDSPQMALVAEASRMPRPQAPPDMSQFEGLTTEQLLSGVQQRLDLRRRALEDDYRRRLLTESAPQGIFQPPSIDDAGTPIDQFIGEQRRAQRRSNLEAGLTLPQIQPPEPVQEPTIGQYPPEGFTTGSIPSQEEQARREQVRQQAILRGQQRAREARQAQQIPQEPQPLPSQLFPAPEPVAPVGQDLRAQALAVAAQQQLAQAQANARRRAAEMKSRPISTTVIDVLANERVLAQEQPPTARSVKRANPLTSTDQGLTEVVQPEGQTPVDDLMGSLRAGRTQPPATPTTGVQFAPGGALQALGGLTADFGGLKMSVIQSPDDPSIGFVTGLSGSGVAGKLNQIKSALANAGFKDIQYRPDNEDGRSAARVRLFEALKSKITQPTPGTSLQEGANPQVAEPVYPKGFKPYIDEDGSVVERWKPSRFDLNNPPAGTDVGIADFISRGGGSYMWRAMGGGELAKLLSGTKTYGGGTSGRGNYLATYPEKSAKIQADYLIEFAGAKPDGEKSKNKLTLDNVTRILVRENGQWRPLTDQERQDLTAATQPTPTKPGVRLRKSPLRSEPAAAQSVATSGAGAGVSPAPSPAVEESVFGVRPYKGAPTITRDAYNQVNTALDNAIANNDPVAKQIRDLDVDAENGVKKSAGYELLSEQGKFEALQRYRNKLYQSAIRWTSSGKFTFNQAKIAKSAAMDVGKSGEEQLNQRISGEQAIGESETETNLTRATSQVSPQIAPVGKTRRARQDAVAVLKEVQSRLGLTSKELVTIIAAYQSQTTEELNDREMEAYEAALPTLQKLGSLDFSVSSLIAEPIGQARAQVAVDEWLEANGNPSILIRVVDDPNLKTPDGRNVAAQIQFSPGGQPLITINGSQIGSEAEVGEKIWHEILHTVWEDPAVQKAWGEVVGQLSEADVQAQLARGYSPFEATMEAAIDKASIRAANTKVRPAWQRFLDSIWQALKRTFGFETRPNNFEELMVSALRAAAGPWNGQQQSRYNQDVAAKDKAYLEAVARGDMAAAQRMVDDAAADSGIPWSGVVDLRDGKVLKTYTRRQAGSVDFHHSLLVDTRYLGMISDGDAEYFFINQGVPASMNGLSPEMVRRIRDQLGSRIKSADPVTYDNAGNVVLLSQRFNPQTGDIRYSVANNLYVTQPERFRRIAEEGQTEAVVAQGQTASAIIPQSTLDEIAALERKENPTPVEKATLSNLKGVRQIAQVAAVADQIRQANEGWGNYRTLNELPDAYKSVAAQSIMATHLYLNQRYVSLKNRQSRVASQITLISNRLNDLTESRLLARVSEQEADQLLKDLQSLIDLEIKKVGTSSASRTVEELNRASAAVVGLRQKQDAIAAALQAIAKEAPLADFASPEAMKAWIESRQADKTKSPLMTDEIANAIRASLKPGSGLPDRLSLIRGLMADTAAAKGQIKELKAKVGNPKTALKTIIALKVDANSVLNQVARLDRAFDRQLIQLDGLDAAIAAMDRMQVSPQYQARVESAFRYGGFKYSGIIRYTERPNGDQTLVGPSGKEYVVNFTPDYTVEKTNLDRIGDWMEETISAVYNPESPTYITDPAKRTSYGNMLAFVARYMTDRRWLDESAWQDSKAVQLLSIPLLGLEKAGMLKAAWGDHLDTRFNAYRLMAGRAGGELVKRSRAIDTFGARAKNLIERTREPLAVGRRKAIESHGFNPDDAADIAIWNRKVNSWILSQNQNPGSTPVKEGDSLGEGLVATKEDLAFAEMQHKFSRELGDIYSGTEVDGATKDPNAPGLSPEEQLFGLDFSRKAMQYGYSIGRQFSEAGQEYTREWMGARAKDLAEHRRRVAEAPEGTEVPMVWDERTKVAEADIEGHVYSHIRESSTDYTPTAGKALRAAYKEVSKLIRRGTQFTTLNDIAEELAPLLSTDEAEVGATEAKEALLKALDRDVVNYNRTTELVTQPSNDPTVSDLPKALAAVRSAKGALVKARGKMVAPSFFYDYSLDTDAKRAGMVHMGKQALQISEINAGRNMLSAMRARLAEYDTKIEARAQQLGRNGKKIGTWSATRELEADLRKKFKAGELMITYTMLRRTANKLETLIKDREDALSRQRVMEEEAFKVAILNAGAGAVASTLLSAPSPIINNLTAVVLDPLRVGLMHGGVGFAMTLYSKQALRGVKYVFQKSADKALRKLALALPKRLREKLLDVSWELFSDMLTHRQELEDSGGVEGAEPFSSIWSRYKANPLSFGDTTRAKETAVSRIVSSVLTSPFLGKGLIPASFEYLRQRFPGAGDRMVNYTNSLLEKELSDRIKLKLWLWVDGLEGSTRDQKIKSAASQTIKPEDLGLTKEQLSNYRTTYDPTGSLERLAMDYYLRNPNGAKGELLTPEQRDGVVFELVSLTNKEVDSTRPDITKGGAGIGAVLKSKAFLFMRYMLQLIGVQKRVFGLKGGAGWKDEFGQAAAYLFLLAMTLATGALVLPFKQAARTAIQNEPLTSPTITQVGENPELLGKYLTAAAGGVMPMGASLVGALTSGQPLMGPITANVLENNPLVGAANNLIGAATQAYQSGDVTYPALDWARKQVWFSQPLINALLPGEAMAREAKRAVRTGAVGMEVRESGGAPAQTRSTPMTPIIRDAVAALYEGDDAKFQAAKQRALNFFTDKGLDAKEAEQRFNSSISGRDPFRSVLGRNPTEEEMGAIMARATPSQRATLSRARTGFSLRKRKQGGLRIRSSRRRPARRRVRLRKQSRA